MDKHLIKNWLLTKLKLYFCSMTSITPSDIIQYLYCPRFTYFEYVLRIPQYEEKHYKVLKGREIHDEKLERNKSYLRRRIGAVAKETDQYLSNGRLRGIVDEVLSLSDGTLSPLDYKFAEYKDMVYDTYRTQLFCYSVLIEDNFAKQVTRGFLVYVRSNNKIVEVPVTEKDKQQVRTAIESVLTIIDENKYPKATKSKKRCLSCTYKNVCTG